MTTLERLEVLENGLRRARRRNRWFLAVIALCIGIGVVFWTFRPEVVMAQPQPLAKVAKEVRANSFVLVDEKGNLRANLCIEKDAVKLMLIGEEGKAGAILSVGNDGPSFTLNDGKALAGLSVERPAVALLDEKGVARDVPATTMSDEKIIRAMFGITPTPMLCLTDENGKPRALLTVDKGVPTLKLDEEKVKPAAAPAVEISPCPTPGR